MKSALVLLAIPIFWTTSCSKPEKYQDIAYVDFTGELGALAENGGISTVQFREMRKKHGRFFDLWLYEIVDFAKYGPVGDSAQAALLSEFLLRNKPVFSAIKKQYQNYQGLRQEISTAFGKLNAELGGVSNPVVYSYFSQFSNYNTFVDTNRGKTYLAFSSEMFMNDTFPLYKLLEVPEFYNRYNATSQIPAMLLWNYLKARFESDELKNMISEAVFNGKIWYTMEQVLDEKELWKQFGYTQKEWEQMIAEEGQIWRHYLNEEALFSSDFNHYKRYFTYGNRTFGSGIPEDCPPLIGNFTGYRIVSAYMEKTKASLPELWKAQDASEILRQSGYNPLK